MYRSLEEICEAAEGSSFYEAVLADDCKERGIKEAESKAQMRAMYEAMKQADARLRGKKGVCKRTCRNRRREAGAGEGTKEANLWRSDRTCHGKGCKNGRIQCLYEADRGSADCRLLWCASGRFCSPSRRWSIIRRNSWLRHFMWRQVSAV